MPAPGDSPPAAVDECIGDFALVEVQTFSCDRTP